MILQSLIFINAIIFLILSLLHFYWAFGGKWAIEATIPEVMKEAFFAESNKMKMMLATLVVAVGLLTFSIITLSNHIEIALLNEYDLTSKLMLVIGIIFSLRAIGDFNIVGLFKKQTNSVFTKNDNKIYTPICIYLGVTCILISLLG